MHCHSIYSDGVLTVEELKKRYKEQGYSIIAFSDHEHLIDNSHLNDKDFLAITSCELSIKEDENLSTLKKLDMKVCHLNLYSKDPHNVDTPCYNSVYDHFTKNSKDIIKVPQCDYKRVYGHEGVSEIIKMANEQGFLVSYNHPNWSLENARDYLGYEGLWAVEVYNYGADVEYCYSDTSYVFDDFLKDNVKIACVSGDDNHREDHCFGGYTMINAEELSYDSIMDALINHNFYASWGPEISELYIEDDYIYITVKGASKVILKTGIRRGESQEVENENKETTLKFKFYNGDKFVRFEVIDNKGRKALTNAIYQN